VTRQLRSELFKQRTTRTTVTLLAWMVGVIVLIVALHVFSLSASLLRKAADQPKVYGWGTTIGSLFAALLGAITVTAEVRKAAASALAGALVGLIAEALVSVIGSAGFAARGIHIALTAGDFAQMLAGGAAAAALWGVIGTGLGAIVRNQTGAVVGLCVWLLLVETILVANVPAAGKFSPGASAGALAGMIQSVSAGTLVAPALGALLLLAYAGAVTAVGLIATERRDVA